MEDFRGNQRTIMETFSQTLDIFGPKWLEIAILTDMRFSLLTKVQIVWPNIFFVKTFLLISVLFSATVCYRHALGNSHYGPIGFLTNNFFFKNGFLLQFLMKIS